MQGSAFVLEQQLGALEEAAQTHRARLSTQSLITLNTPVLSASKHTWIAWMQS